ncbi:MAG: hypothetical protein NC350_02420 [Corallococcus sp.]|nr:hypothetical protein [Corallococcus sp.]
MAKKIKVRKNRSPVVRFAIKILKVFWGKYKVINLNDETLPDRCIVLGNHNGLRGPIAYQCYMPRYCVPWGAHEMLGRYRVRWNYLYHVFYRQKLHLGKCRSFFKATFLGLFTKIFYRGVGLIGTYTDARQIGAIRKSMAALEYGVPVVIFPENSSEGYFEELTQCHGGFVQLADRYRKVHDADLPVYPTYFSKKYKSIAIGKPIYVGQLRSQGMSRYDIAELARVTINGLRDVCATGGVDKQ